MVQHSHRCSGLQTSTLQFKAKKSASFDKSLMIESYLIDGISMHFMTWPSYACIINFQLNNHKGTMMCEAISLQGIALRSPGKRGFMTHPMAALFTLCFASIGIILTIGIFLYLRFGICLVIACQGAKSRSFSNFLLLKRTQDEYVEI